ncbi:MAG TPA: HAMP domain-containing sensor histidine kinase [Nevskiaceae bacterium]|nr:HAMP domain-containing sensor histidine kinase [Nevskiaceae bacterium]
MRLQRVRLRTILLLINLVILVLPLGGIFWLRIYESALVRQTESELIAQGVFVASAYDAIFTRVTQNAAREPRTKPFDVASYGQPLTAPEHPADPEGRWRPQPAELDLASDTIHPRPPDAEPGKPADFYAEQVGMELTPMLRSAQTVTLAGIRVVDHQGTVVASTSEDFGMSLANHEEVQRALTGEPVSFLRSRVSEHDEPALASISRGTRIRVFVAVPIVHRDRVLGAVLLARTPANIKQAMFGKRRELALAGLLLLGVVLMLSLFASRMIALPVQNLMAQARRAARGEQGAVIPLEHPGTREIAELSETVATMAQALESRSNYIRDFAAHVSHEFKTPLTAIQGAVELLRDHAATMSSEERVRFLNILAADAQRLENLVRRLLELARADVMRVGADRADVAAVLPATLDRHREAGMEIESVGLKADPHRGPIEVAMNAETLDSILSSLLDNVRQHAGAGVRTRVSWSREGDEAVIDVQDEGAGISSANAQRIFEPFFTTARQQGNTGLGLSIIRSLLVAHRGDISLLPATRGAHFRIRLPIARSDGHAG